MTKASLANHPSEYSRQPAVHFLRNAAILLVAVVAAAGCSLVDQESEPVVDSGIVIFDTFDQIEIDSSGVHFRSVKVAAAMLTMDIRHGGGCEEHEYALYGWSKIDVSSAPAAHLYFSHEDNDDRCEALIHETLTYDLQPLLAEWRRVTRHDGPIEVAIHEPAEGNIAATVTVEL